jgi:hypothetical protein
MSLRRRAQSKCVPSELETNGDHGEVRFQLQHLIRATDVLHNASAAARRDFAAGSDQAFFFGPGCQIGDGLVPEAPAEGRKDAR